MERKVEMARAAGTASKVGETTSKTVEAEREGARAAWEHLSGPPRGRGEFPSNGWIVANVLTVYICAFIA